MRALKGGFPGFPGEAGNRGFRLRGACITVWEYWNKGMDERIGRRDVGWLWEGMWGNGEFGKRGRCSQKHAAAKSLRLT